MDRLSDSQMESIAMCNQKGGVGKTEATWALEGLQLLIEEGGK